MKEEARKVEKLLSPSPWLSKEEYENIQTEGGKAGGERRRKGRRLEAMAEIRREGAE